MPIGTNAFLQNQFPNGIPGVSDQPMALSPGLAASVAAAPTPAPPPPVTADSLVNPQYAPMNTDTPSLPKPGLLQRVKDWVTDPANRAEMFRSGATMLAGGNLGEGLKAGADYKEQQQQQQFSNQLAISKYVMDAHKAALEEAEKLHGLSKPDVTTIDGVAYDSRTHQPLFESPYPRVIPGPNGSFMEQPRIGLGTPPQAAPGQAVPAAAPAVPAPVPSTSVYPTPRTQQEFDAIPPGSSWVDSQGRTRLKGVATPGSQSFP